MTLQLRKTTDLEKIKVRDICRLSYINTTTFYNHYEDDIALTFVITGGIQTMYLLMTEGKYTSEQLESKIAECIGKVFPSADKR